MQLTSILEGSLFFFEFSTIFINYSLEIGCFGDFWYHKTRFGKFLKLPIVFFSPGIPSPTALGNNCPRKRFRSCSCSYDFQSGKVCKDGVGHFGVQQFSILIYDLPLKTSQERTKGLGLFFYHCFGLSSHVY